MKRKLRHLLLATLEDPSNPRSWSGIPFRMRLALEQKVDRLSVLANLKPRRTPINAALRLLLGGNPPRYPLYLTRAAQGRFARETLRAIDDLKPDALLTISSHCVVRMGIPPVPTFMVTDAPWLSWKNTYAKFEPMPLLGPRFARLEAAAAHCYTGQIFSSDWAVDEAQRLYDVPRDKLHSISFGATWTPDVTTEALDAIIRMRSEERLELLFVGKDWERKGGPLALEIALELQVELQRDVRLHIVGCTPSIPERARDLVQVHGFLNVKVPEESRILQNLYLNSHFLVVPTRAECYGIVFAEAQAYGLPPVSRAVQAVPSIVINDKTGILEPADAPASAYVRRIAALMSEPGRYLAMGPCSDDQDQRARRHQHLCWEAREISSSCTKIPILKCCGTM